MTGRESLYPGYSVKTGRLSAASLRMEDESLMRLSENAEFKVEGVQLTSFWRRATALVSGINQGVRSSYRLISGKLWGRNNNRNLNAQVITTTATIGIRGTEYMIEASENAKIMDTHISALFIASRFCVVLPSDPASRQRPCPFANLRLCEYLVRGLTPR